jgi:L-fuconolactonase
MKRIDAHQHFWHYNPAGYGWISDEMAALKQDFLPQDLQPLLAATGFDGSVAVEARQSLEETRWLLELSARHESILAVVGWADLCSDELPRQLEMFCKHSKFKGVRHVLQDEPDDQFMLRSDFRRGISRLREFNLTYDLLIHTRHLPIAVKLVEEFPEQPFVLDHLAKPSISNSKIAGPLLSPWREDIQALAALPNVYCKLSGMVTEAKWNEWQPQDFIPYLDAVFAAFGAERLMIGSDWPVCTLAGDYASTMDIVISYLRQFPPQVQDGILGGNCARFYKVDD